METTLKALPKFEVPNENSKFQKHRHQQTENIFNERGIKYEMKFLQHQNITGLETHQIRTIEKSAQINVGKSAHLCQKIFADIKEAEALGAILPAIVVIKNLGKNYTMIDGRHRFAVLSEKNKEIPAYVVQENLPDGDCDALATVLNDQHGTPNDPINRKKHAFFQAINYINTQLHTINAHGGLSKLIKEASEMFQLSCEALTTKFEIDESERLMRKNGASESAIENIGTGLKRNLRKRLEIGEQDLNLKLINSIANSGLEQTAIQDIVRKNKKSTTLQLIQEIKSSSKITEEGRVKKAGEIARDQAAQRFVQTINGALGLLENRNPHSLKLSADQKSDVRKDLAAIEKESARWSKLFEEDLDA